LSSGQISNSALFPLKGTESFRKGKESEFEDFEERPARNDERFEYGHEDKEMKVSRAKKVNERHALNFFLLVEAN
jgi:hypothetical protein